MLKVDFSDDGSMAPRSRRQDMLARWAQRVLALLRRPRSRGAG